MGIEDSKLYQDYFKEKDKKKNAQKGSIIFSYKDWLCLLPLLPAMGFTAILVIGAMESGWQIEFWQTPLIVFVIFVSLLFIFFAVVIYCENHDSKIKDKILFVFFTTIGICCFATILITPFKEVYYCENNSCNAKEYSIIRTRDTLNSPFTVDDTYKKIGMNDVYKKTHVNNIEQDVLLWALTLVGNQWDKNNLVRFKNAKGAPIKLFSYDNLILYVFLILGCISFITIFWQLYFNKPKWFYSLLLIILLRVLYIVFLV